MKSSAHEPTVKPSVAMAACAPRRIATARGLRAAENPVVEHKETVERRHEIGPELVAEERNRLWDIFGQPSDACSTLVNRRSA